MKAINYDLLNALPSLRGGPLSVLMALVLRSNVRARCWPDVDTLIEDTGYSRPAVVSSLALLRSRLAFVDVPFSQRAGLETRLHNRRGVYQLTGGMLISDSDETSAEKLVLCRYFFLNPQDEAELILAAISMLKDTDPFKNVLTSWLTELTMNNGSWLTELTMHNKELELYPKKDASAAKAARPAPVKTERKRDPVFDSVCRVFFGIDPTNTEALKVIGGGGRVGAVTSALKALSPDMDTLPGLIDQFAVWYDETLDGAAMPRDKDKVAEHWIAFQQSGAAAQKTVVAKRGCDQCGQLGYIKTDRGMIPCPHCSENLGG